MLILKLLIFSIPVTFAAILHMVAVKINLFPFLKIPIDFGRSINGKRIFGDNKTYRGVVLLVIFSILGSYFLWYLERTSAVVREHNILDFHNYSPVLYGLLFGIAYTLFELPNSFIKRRFGIEEGKRGAISNIIADQIDSPIGCMLVIMPFSSMDFRFFAAGIVFYLFLHMFFNFLLFLLKLRKNPL